MSSTYRRVVVVVFLNQFRVRKFFHIHSSMGRIISFAEHRERIKLEKIREHLNTSLGLNLSKKSVKFLFTPPDDIMENWYDKISKKSKILNFKHAQNRKFNEENTVEFTTDDEEMTFEFELEEDETDNIH